MTIPHILIFIKEGNSIKIIQILVQIKKNFDESNKIQKKLLLQKKL